MGAITFSGGPLDGDTRAISETDAEKLDWGCVLRSDAMGAIRPRYVVYLPDGRGDLIFHAYAETLDEGVSMLRKG